MTNEEILQQLSQVIHPDKNQDIVTLGLVENLTANSGNIDFTLHFPVPRDPFANAIKLQCEKVLKASFSSAQVQIALQFMEPKKEEATKPQDTLKDVKNIVAVMSGKGGVGKSTVAANLAVALSQKKYKVGLIDADIYGPSLPKMFGVEDEKPLANAEGLVEPVEKYGVKLLSIGFFVKPADALIWRAPMAVSALKQLLLQATWGELDFLFIDMPPGTGDIHLTLVNELKLSGAIVVSTPQQVALADAVRGIAMLQHENVNVKVLGLVENMAWFTPAELPQNRYYIFGKEGTRQLADKMQLPLLGEIPLVQSICDSGDAGIPEVLHESIAKEAFENVANNLIQLTMNRES